MKDDGAVKAMMGGVSYKDNQFNRAVNAKRQPGSAFKLFVYGAALEHGYNIESIVEDKPITIGNWSPKNFTRRYKGRMRLKQSFEESINTIAVQLMQDVGTSNVINFAHKLGVTEKLPNFPSLALGTKEIPMLEMTASYGAISNGGLKVTPYAITKIIDRTANKVLFSYNSKKDVVLTGTSQDFRDAWFFGFTSNLVASIWVGNDNNTHMKGITGGKLPALIWHDTMVEIFEKK